MASYRTSSGIALALAYVALSACNGDVGGDGDDKEVPGPPDVEPKEIPALDKLESVASCSPLREGETLLAVSPEGHAWLAVPGETSSVRVLDAFGGEMAEVIEEIELKDVQDALAWSNVDAALVADDSLWRLDGLARIELTPPQGFSTPAMVCGNPSENGAVLSAGSLFEMHDDGQWWAWKPEVAAAGAPKSILRFDGECQSAKNITWLTAEDGTLYEVDPAEFSRPVKFAKMVDAAATDERVFVLEADKLWVGPKTWQPWTFPGEMPKQISASNGKAWMVSGKQLIRTDGEDFVEVTHGMTDPIERVFAHADGAWLVGKGEVCHQAVGPMIRVEGVRPNLRNIELEYTVRVRASDTGAKLTATLDGKDLPLTADTDPAWMLADVRLEIGWHDIEISAEAGGVVSSRKISVKRIPETSRSWKVDIEPIYAANCASSDCHKPSAPKAPDLASYEAWKEYADEIRTRVVEAKTMPPAANAGPDWNETQIEVISQWLEGGMQP